jgi:hypothetical protein
MAENLSGKFPNQWVTSVDRGVHTSIDEPGVFEIAHDALHLLPFSFFKNQRTKERFQCPGVATFQKRTGGGVNDGGIWISKREGQSVESVDLG